MNSPSDHDKKDIAKKLRVCMADIEALIGRTKLLCEELAQQRLLPLNDRKDPAYLANAISFKELRQFDLRCRDVLQGQFPDLAEKWYVMKEKELASENEILTHLQTKRVDLQHALSRLGIEIDIKNEEPVKEKVEDVILLKPSFFGMGIDLKAGWRWFTKRRKNRRKNGKGGT